MTESNISAPSKDIRQFAAAGVFVLLLIALLMYLTFIPVPESNKDIVVTIIGVLMGGAASAMPKLFGDASRTEDEAHRRVSGMQKKLVEMESRYEVLKSNYDSLVERLVDKHIIDSD